MKFEGRRQKAEGRRQKAEGRRMRGIYRFAFLEMVVKMARSRRSEEEEVINEQ
jgi:hypothetical protein